MIKTVKEYFDERAQFFAQHKYDYNMTTSPMDEYGRYFKTYTFSDGAYWYESKGLTTHVCYEKF